MEQHRRTPHRITGRSPDSGFAFMPLILTILIIGALIGAGMSLLGPRVKKAKYTEAGSTISAAIDAILSWSAANGRLPDTALFATVVRNTIDPWRKPLVYGYDNALTATATGGICGRQTTAITFGAVTDVAFVIASGGDDYAVGSTPNASGAFNGDISVAAGDVVRRVTLAELKARAGCYGDTAGRLRLINKELPTACSGQAYTAAVHADGGVPFSAGGDFKWCLKGALPGGLSVTPPTPSCPGTTGCYGLGTEAASQWSQATTLQMSGTPTVAGTAAVTVLARDNNDNNTGTSQDNCVQKTYQITVNNCGGGPAPVSKWGFDEGTGTVTGDGAGGHDGSLVGNVAWTVDTPDGSGSALSFDGSGDFVRIPHDVDFRITDELTLAAWVKSAADRPFAKVLSRRSGNYFYFLGIDNGHPYGGVGDGVTYAVTGKSLLMSLQEWHHLAFVYDHAQNSMFIHFDGTERATSTALILPAIPGVDVSIGADSAGTSAFFTGAVDDVAVYALALSSTQIRDITRGTLTVPRAAYYDFNGDAIDGSGNGHDGVVIGASFTQDRSGVNNRALALDGSDHVLVSDHADFQITGQLTVMAWVKETAPGTFAKVLSRRSGNYFYFLGVDNGHPYGGIGDGASFVVTRKSISMPPGVWHHIAFIYNQTAGTIQIYYDGIVDKTDVTIILPAMDNIDLTIGGDSEGTGNFFEGLIDEVAVYDTALTDDEIRQIY